MSTLYPVMRSFDPYQQRLGYLNCVTLVAGRDLDRRDALAARLHDMIFERVEHDDPRWNAWFEKATEEGQKAIQSAMAKAASNDPAAILRPTQKDGGWVYIQDLWFNDRQMASNNGPISSEAIASDEAKLYRPIEFAKWIELLLPTYELSENGVIAKNFLEKKRAELGENFNPMVVLGIEPLQLLYTRMILSAECLFPTLLGLLVSGADKKILRTSGQHGLLLSTVQGFLNTIGEPADPSEILEIQGLLEFKDSLLKSNSTAENYLRPRLEILVDLGLLGKQARSDQFAWSITDTTRRCCDEWLTLANREKSVERYLDAQFFGSMANVFGRQNKKIIVHDQILKEFALAYLLVGREFGFTSGRTVATVACINAWCNNQLLEIDSVFEAVYAAAKSNFGKYLHFSGGSRFDKEFLIRISPELLKSLA